MLRVSCGINNNMVNKMSHQQKLRTPLYLEDALVVPVRVDLAQLHGNPVVLSHEDGVKTHQHHLLVDTRIA